MNELNLEWVMGPKDSSRTSTRAGVVGEIGRVDILSFWASILD